MEDKTIPSFKNLKHPVSGEICIYPGSFQQKHLDSAVKLQAKQGDIFICSSPKCGTTWLQTIVWLIVHKGHMFTGNIIKHMPMLEFCGAEAVDVIDTSIYPRIIKSHFKRSWVPQNPKAKYIYITRNPKDAVVSYFYHCKGFTQLYNCEELDFDKLFDLYVRSEVEFWGYFDQVTDWYVNRDEENVLFLLYEDLKLNVENQILKIAKFLEGDYYQALCRENGKLLREVVEKSSFSAMKESIVMIKRPDDLPFIRKGKVGDWKNHLSHEQSEQLDDMIRKKGGPSGWDKLWDGHKNIWTNK